MVRVIGVLKLAKAALLAALGVGGVGVGKDGLARLAERTVAIVGGYSGRHLVGRLLDRVWALDPSSARRLAALSLCYAGVFAVEGVGLVMGRHWAEWLTVIVTASFIPIEIYELVTKPGAGKVAALIVNVAIVAYLAWRRLRERGLVGSPVRA
jgi:uncharacterized membrane protein (DUF2068 family)